MNKQLKNIIAGQGLGNLKFGLAREQVKQLLGEPDESETYSYTESEQDLTESWHYDELELSISFDEDEDWRLVTICISSDFYEFQHFNPVGMNKTELVAQLNKLEIRDLEYEDCSADESPNHELYSSDDLGMNFWIDEGIVTEVQWGPLLIDDENIDWPE